MKKEKLKTLKDIYEEWQEKRERAITLPKEYHHLFMRNNPLIKLKQEAIKWIKNDIKGYGLELAKMVNYRLMLFLNITEEDLK